MNVANGNNWVHNPAHRDGVPYNNRAVANRFQGGSNLPSGRPTAGQVQQGLGQAGRGGPGGFAGQGNIGRGGGQVPGQGGLAGRGGAGALPGQGANRMAPGNIAPGAGNRGGVPANLGQGGANRMAPGAMGGNANRIGNRQMPTPSPAAGAFGGMNQGGNRVRMDSNRGASSRGFGGGGFGGGGSGAAAGPAAAADAEDSSR